MSLAQTLTAVTRAMRGEFNEAILHAILSDWRMTCIVALSNSIHPTLRTIASLVGDLPSLLTSDDIGHPDVSDVVRRLIGVEEGIDVIKAWAHVVSAGWGADSADVLRDAVAAGRCNAGCAAALIGPCSAAVSLLETPVDAAFAVYRWGVSRSDDPTWWTTHLSAAERNFLIDLVWDTLDEAAGDEVVGQCVPWLPEECVINTFSMSESLIGSVLMALAAAAPSVRQRHAALIHRLLPHTGRRHLGAIVHLACATGAKDLWNRVLDMLRDDVDASASVVFAAPWNELPENVRHAILQGAADSDICAAVAAARGWDICAPVTWHTSAAFFAALDPKVWTALVPAEQHTWLLEMEEYNAHLAIRSIGPQTSVLKRTALSDACVRATRKHIVDMDAVRRTLLPVALRLAPISSVPSVMDAYSDPLDDSVAFFHIASACPAAVPIALPRESLLQTPADLAAAIVIRRIASYDGALQNRCEALQSVFRMQTQPQEKWNRILELLPAHIRERAIPKPQTVINRLAHPDRMDAFCQALNRVCALSLDIAVPALHALDSLHHAWNRMSAFEAFSAALRGHGALVADIINACNDAIRDDLFPPLDPPALTTLLRDMIIADPLVACRLARALRDRSWRHVRNAFLVAPLALADSIAAALSDNIRSSLLDDVVACVSTITDCARLHEMQTFLRQFAEENFVASFALAALSSDDPDEQSYGVVVLRELPQIVRIVFPLLRHDIQKALRSHPDLCLLLADLPDAAASPAFRTQERRRRRHCG